ncbi:dynein light chain Tctex-type 5-B-like [Tubulanus polymorphus]|uniref:dynein light chain Tctex-type 5-B-like n=1 Tax=Tubulanus polymorphus TaxID=672921 RepID=UPI003DA3D610
MSDRRRMSREPSSSDVVARDRASSLLKKRFSVMSMASAGSERRATLAKRGSMSTISYADEPSEIGMHGPHVRLENTYQLKPNKSFPQQAVTEMIKETLENYLAHETYEPEMCKLMSKTISEVIKGKVKDLRIPRYKIICLVNIGQQKQQGLLLSSRCLWDASVDTSATSDFKNKDLFAVGTVYGIYMD